MTDDTKQPEKTEEPAEKQQPKQAEYHLSVGFLCPYCNQAHGLTDPRALVAASNRALIGLKCPGCGGDLRLIPPKPPEKSLIVKPNQGPNRHERRVMEAARKGGG